MLVSLDPEHDLIKQLQVAIAKHTIIEVDLDAWHIQSLLPQVIHQALVDPTIRSYIDGVYLKNTIVAIEQSTLSFSVQAILDFIGPASFLGRNKIAVITGNMGMKGERAIIKSLDIDIPNLGFFQKGMFAAGKSSITDTVTNTDVNEALVAALHKEGVMISSVHIQIKNALFKIHLNN